MKKQLNSRVNEEVIEMKDKLIEKIGKENIGKITTSTIIELAVKRLYENEIENKKRQRYYS